MPGVADVVIGLHAHKDYLARQGTPKKPADLVWVTMHEDLRGGARCKVTFDALVDALAARK